VNTNANSRRPSQSAPIPISALTDPRSTRRSEFLIANARLKINPSQRKLSLLQIPNRERIAFFESCPRTSLVTHRSPRTTAFLIVTSELRFPATPRKQTSGAISNRYKTAFLTIRSGLSSRPPSGTEGSTIGSRGTSLTMQTRAFNPVDRPLIVCHSPAPGNEGASATAFLIGTLGISKIGSTHSKQTRRRNSNRYKNAICRSQPLDLCGAP
jgi:hypothetical protein